MAGDPQRFTGATLRYVAPWTEVAFKRMAIEHIDPVAAGKASGRARYAAMLANADRVALVDKTIDVLDAHDIGTKMLQAAVNLVQAAAEGTIPQPETPLERKQLADAAKVIYMMGRLELGESTSNVAHATVEDKHVRMEALRDRFSRVEAED